MCRQTCTRSAHTGPKPYTIGERLDVRRLHTWPHFPSYPAASGACKYDAAAYYRAATFPLKREAVAWAKEIETQAHQVAASGFAQPPKGATLADLIDTYNAMNVKEAGKTKAATLAMLKDRMGKVKLASLSALVLRDFIDKRIEDGAGGVTIAGDLSFLSGVLKWGRYARHLNLTAAEARAALKHRGLDTRQQGAGTGTYRRRTRAPLFPLGSQPAPAHRHAHNLPLGAYRLRACSPGKGCWRCSWRMSTTS